MSGGAAPSLVSVTGALMSAGEVVPASAGPGTVDDHLADRLVDRMLPVREDIAAVLPWQGLRRGSTVAVHGSGSLLLALLAAATANGSWAAVVGMPSLGLLAAQETGVAVERLALVPWPGDALATVTAALLDGMDLVALAGALGAAEARKLSARARHRRSVLLSFGPWPGADLELSCTSARWRGIGEGHGYLRAREVILRVGGRGAAARPRTTTLLLPGLDEPGARESGFGELGAREPGSRESGARVERAVAG